MKQRHGVISVLIALLLLAASARPQAPQAPKPPQAPQAPQAKAEKKMAAEAKPAEVSVPFEKYVLPNGLELILHPDKKLPVVHVNLWYHVGSKNEKPGRTGFAHLFEHMMFQGSKDAPGEYLSYVEKAGANLFTGGVNGTTNSDRTNYFETVPAGSLEYILWLESDRLATLADHVDQAMLDNQREVVRNERRQGLENQPYGRAFKLASENLYPAGHPYSWPVIGSHEDLKAASLDDVKEFFRTYYSPNNLSLVIAGDFDSAEAKRLVEKYFGGIEAGAALDRPARWLAKLDGEKVVEVADRVPQERTYFVWPSAPYFEKGDAELDLTSVILTDGLSSRLNRALVYDKQLATTVSSFQSSEEIAGEFYVVATARPGASLEEVEKIVTAEIARLAKDGPTQEELDRAKTKTEYAFVSGLERIGGFGGKSDMLNRYNTFLGNPDMFQKDLGRYRAVTVDEIRQTADKWLNTRNRLLIRFHPEKGGRIEQASLDRSQTPQLAEDSTFQVPQVKQAKLENGLELFVVERHELPKVAVQLVTRGGSIYDPSGKAGVATLAARTMDKGTAARGALEIEDAFGNLGTDFSASAAKESAGAGFAVLRRNLEPALSLFAEVVRTPTFPEKEFEREKKRQLDVLGQQSVNANALAQRISPMLAFGADNLYGRPISGLPETVEAITRDDLVQYHRRTWHPDRSALIFVGDITLAEAKNLAQKEFGDWKAAEAAPKIESAAAHMADPTKVYIVDRQGAAQTVVAQILPGIERSNPDYYVLQLADAVWGGGFTTRLNLNLREDKGYSYGTFSTPTFYSKAGMWRAMGGVQTDKTKESVVEFEKELKGISGEKPITELELEDARANRVRGYAQEFEALSQVAGQIAGVWADGMPMSELQRAVREMQSATLEQVNAVAQKYAQPDKSVLLLVGDREKIEPGIRELNLGPIVVLDAEGRPVQQAASAGGSE